VSAWGKEAGLELEDVKTLLWHEDIATTSNVYVWEWMQSDESSSGSLPSPNQQAKEAQQDSRIEDAWANTPVTIQ